MTELEDIISTADSQEETEPLSAEAELSVPAIGENITAPVLEPTEIGEADALRQELSELKSQIEEKRTREERALRELEEFSRLYPDARLEELDEGVWERVREGLPLSAAYALYEREKELLASLAENVNMRNAARSAGGVGLSAPQDYFSPEEVRAMSGAEVRKNYESIRRSMNYWQKAAK